MEKLYKHPWLILLVIALVTVFFTLQLPRLELDNNNFRFISENDPARQASARIDDTFGSSLFILVALHRTYGDVFDPGFLNLIRKYVDRVEAIEIIDPVSSIVNADYITGDSDSITVEKLLGDDFSGTPEEIARLKGRLLSWDLYRRSLISDDFSSTQILVPMNVPSEDAGKPEVVDSFIQVRDIAREMFAGQAEVYVSGLPVISATINEAVRADLRLLVPLVVLVVLFTLFFSFRRLAGVVLPLLTVLIAALWSMGAMALFNIKLSVISTVLPVILVAVGSAYGIHVITHYLEDLGTGNMDRAAHKDFVLAMVKKIIKPVFLAALTTFVGFISFCFTTVLPIREFGVFASFGVIVSFGVAVTMIPALLIIRGPGPFRAKRAGGKQDALGRVMADFFPSLVKHRILVLAGAAAVILVSLAGASRIIIDNVFVEYFRPDTNIAESDRFIREQFGGSKVVSIVAEAPSGVLLGPACLSAMDDLNRYMETRVPEVGKVMGFTDMVKRINQVFNADESPGGIKKSGGITEAPPAPEGDEFTFGFDEDDAAGDDFGFGNFGVDDAAEFGFGAFEKDEAPPPEESPAAERIYTLEDIAGLFDAALKSGSTVNPGAGELVKELKRALNFEGASYYEIPADPARYGKTRPGELADLVSNYLVLLSGSVDSYANDPLEPTAIKTTVQFRTLGESDTARALDAIYGFVEDRFPRDVKVTVGGSALVESSLNKQVVRSQLISVLSSLFLVFIILAASNRSLAAGCVGIVSLVISILFNFAVMGFLGIKLDIGTSMIASLAVGIGIDYTIHYMAAFKREYARHGLKATFAVSGRAIIINAFSVGLGFAVILFSRFNMLANFGLLIALTMITSALVSLTVIPALLLTFKPKFAMTPEE
ncbi:MAG: MMPL family transporter [Treponema sp.]|jgi:predicted RND superfamily exporter protein|nr:MMPL family transporter [Treponema sp.]